MVEHSDEADNSPARALAGIARVARDAEAERALAAVRSRLFATEEPTRLGRFLVIKRLGAGNSGVVYAAYDPDLDRKVAIKVLRLRGQLRSRGRARLVREAKAMARLNCPNVVAVYELGTNDGGELFVVMELVEGNTLTDWLKSRGNMRDSDAIMSVILKAGHGLAAAHAAGLVHRDFKPDNVLIAEDGSVRVADFGLASFRALHDGEVGSDGTAESPSAASAATSDRAAGSSPESVSLTRSGALVGTPTYMAPEVLAGNAADAFSDQYSFCVTLFEALCNKLPHRGESVAELYRAAMEEVPSQAAPGSLPGWLRRILLRGLKPDPKQRFGSLAALLKAIETHRTRRRRGALLGAGVATLLALAALVSWRWRELSSARPTALCSGSKAALEHVWNGAERARLKRAFAADTRAYAAETFRRTSEQLDRYASQWVKAHRDTCLATHERGEQSQATLFLRMRCLERRRAEMGALVSVLSQADGAAVSKALRAVSELTAIEVCDDVEALARSNATPEDPRVAAELKVLRSSLDIAEQRRRVGMYQRARLLADNVLSAAEALGFVPFVADVRVVLGDLQAHNGDYQAAQASFRQAFAEGLASGNDRAAASAAIRATGVVGFRLHQPKDGHRWAWLAGSVLARLGEDVSRQAQLSNNQGNVYFAEQNYDEAAARFERAIQLYTRAHGADHLKVGFMRVNLGAVRRKQGRLDEGLRQLRLAEHIIVANLGAGHPTIGRVLNSLGNVYWARGDFAMAARYHRRALSLKEATLPAGHSSIAHSCNNLADVLVHQRRFDEASVLYQRALTIWQQAAAGPRLVALARRGVAHCQLDKGEHRRAAKLLETVLAEQQRLHIKGAEQGMTRFWLARALWPERASRQRALTLARSAEPMLRRAAHKRCLTQLQTWLSSHGGG